MKFDTKSGCIINFLMKIHAHKFRHTFAVKAVVSGIPLNVLQKWLSHSSIFVTSIYTDITCLYTTQFINRIQYV
ncbi:tyrosine-type recombinase/integrase [Caldisphaera sp.]|uniref:tyrosine-type recombinase/integrase n=1 Tax=Caldisphaera sp. TaxID=2060322 RepID=UPI00345B4FB6